MNSTASRVPDCRARIIWVISSVESCTRRARLRTSSATTAKPRPISPARAASMAALRASRLVCSAMPWITLTTPLIFWLSSASFWIISAVSWTPWDNPAIDALTRLTACWPAPARRSASCDWSRVSAACWAIWKTVVDISLIAVAVWSVSLCWPSMPWRTWPMLRASAWAPSSSLVAAAATVPTMRW